MTTRPGSPSHPKDNGEQAAQVPSPSPRCCLLLCPPALPGFCPCFTEFLAGVGLLPGAKYNPKLGLGLGQGLIHSAP